MPLRPTRSGSFAVQAQYSIIFDQQEFINNSRITVSFNVTLGKPVVRGTRLTVELLLRKMSEGARTADLLRMYSRLEATDVRVTIEESDGYEDFWEKVS